MKKLLIVGCVLLLTACTPKEYSLNIRAGQEQLQEKNFAAALTSFEKAQNKKTTEEVKVFIKAAHLLNESAEALQEGKFDQSIQKAEKVQAIDGKEDIKNTINTQAERLISESQNLSNQQKAMEEELAKGKKMLEKQQFGEAYAIFEKAKQNRETDNQAIAVLSKKLTDLMDKTTNAKKVYEEKIAKEKAEKQKQEALRLAAEKRAQEEAIRLAEEQKQKQQAAERLAAAQKEKKEKERTTMVQQKKQTAETSSIEVQQPEQKTASSSTVQQKTTTVPHESNQEENTKQAEEKQTTELTSSQAVQLVKNHLNINNDKMHVEYDHMDGDNYIIHVFEVVIDDPKTNVGHTATYGWYGVNKYTKKIYDAFN
ncbi:hypothetical protein [Niallia sp. NCCP-28]|uniref:hypothetical protein n=1 Tax=Niallia sp. NCCP-28 TaxID=2934712 RepID=UPI0020862A89|nr:hypothetical protein [Niallia sp. NCCP-28]GKU83020.1 hypothetical protein NCCP28_24160 [Niallia sp. NCCP-28]